MDTKTRKDIELMIKKEGTVQVYENSSGQSDKFLYSKNFTTCNALIFSDGNKGVFMHLSAMTPPEKILEGKINTFYGEEKCVGIDEVFSDPTKVRIMNIYWERGFFEPQEVNNALIKKGYDNIKEVMISKDDFRPRDILFDVKNSEAYIISHGSEIHKKVKI